MKQFSVLRTTTDNHDFLFLVKKLDRELFDELKEDQATYDPLNNVSGNATAIVIYHNQRPVASGCFKQHPGSTVEIKRMFVEKEFRGKGLSKLVLGELENWAKEKDYTRAILETSIRFKPARGLYASAGYKITPNYPPYVGLEESVCMEKHL